jgi:hypothetical protein
MTLLIVRFFAMILLLTLLFQPVLQISDEYVQKPDLAVLIDKSKSLQITDGDLPRYDSVIGLLAPHKWAELDERFNLHFFPFATEIDTSFIFDEADSIRFDQDGTDISRAMDLTKKRLLDQFYAAAVVVSDGNYNSGENPEFFAQRYGIPIHTVGIGNPNQKKDVVLARVLTNEVVYANNRVPLDVTVMQDGFKGQRIEVFLKQNDTLIDRQRITLGEDGQEQRIRLFFTPEESGFQEYKVEIPALQDEFTSRNNFRSLFVKVLESKIRILLLAGEPSLDFKFIQKAFETDENIRLASLVQNKGGGFYSNESQQSILREDFQLMIFLGFPRWPVSIELVNYLEENLVRQKKPLFFIQTPNVDLAALRIYSDLLPFELRTPPRSTREVVVDPTIFGENSSIVLISENRGENRRMWNNLPPILTFMNNVEIFPDGEVLLQVEPALSKLPPTSESRKPILVSRQLGEQKTLAFLGYGLWRWDLMMWGVGKSNELLLNFLQKSVRWLITREEVKQVKIATDKLVYRSGEQVYAQAQVYTQDYQPVEGAVVKLSVSHSGEQKDYVMESVGSGKYETQFRIFQGGDYEFRGEASRADQFFGADSGKFSAGEFELEFQQTRMNEPLLQRIAQVSGGTYFTPETIDQLPEKLQGEGRMRVKNSEINLWSEWWSLIIPILFLAVEWTLRRRRGML